MKQTSVPLLCQFSKEIVIITEHFVRDSVEFLPWNVFAPLRIESARFHKSINLLLLIWRQLLDLLDDFGRAHCPVNLIVAPRGRKRLVNTALRVASIASNVRTQGLGTHAPSKAAPAKTFNLPAP